MPIVKSLEGFRVALLGSFDRFGFAEFIALPSPGVGQVSYSGRIY
jgi:hypothetical protein